MTQTHRIAVIAGDGIGKEVMPEGLRVLEAAASRFGIDLRIDHFDFSSWDYFERHGKMLPDDWKAQIGGHDAIFFGAVGWPQKIADHVSLWGFVAALSARLRSVRESAPGALDGWDCLTVGGAETR